MSPGSTATPNIVRGKGKGKKAQKVEEKLNWVKCDKCQGKYLFEHCGLIGEYEKTMKDVKYECRLCKLEAKGEEADTFKDRLSDIEEAIKKLGNRIEKIETSVKLKVDKKLMSEVVKGEQSQGETLENKSNGSEKETDGAASNLEELSSRTTLLEGKMINLEEEINYLAEEGAKKDIWIMPRRRKQMRIKTSNEESLLKSSFAEKFKNKAKDTVVVLGDSLVRGVGRKLQANSHMFTTICKGGAKIEDMEQEFSKLQDREDRHLVVMVGTNNIKEEGSEVVIEKYGKLIEQCKGVKSRKVTVVGIPTRYDVNGLQNSRRLSVNSRLKTLCNQSGLEYIGYECSRSRLARDRLHHNDLGQEELAKLIFSHCKSFLV